MAKRQRKAKRKAKKIILLREEEEVFFATSVEKAISSEWFFDACASDMRRVTGLALKSGQAVEAIITVQVVKDVTKEYKKKFEDPW